MARFFCSSLTLLKPCTTKERPELCCRIRACFILQLLSMVTTCTGFETPVEGKDHQKIFLVQMVLKSSMRVHKLNVYLMLYYAPSNAICTVFHITHTILTYPVL
ncbi:hypothetical protein NC651_019073 [Populus alba x Populus x berolinensis]|nr:hypothetical protein NC651_019073 [Populus alba x Populus x berolinensis]